MKALRSNILCLLLLSVLGSLSLAGRAVAASDLKVTGLRCELRKDPLGVEAASPRLAWILTSRERGQRPTAWQVLVASTPELLKKNQGDLWDSGKVTGAESNQVAYAGKPLASRARCFWKVRVWGKDGAPTAWSESARWTMGLTRPEDWQAKWIRFENGAAPKPAAAAPAARPAAKKAKGKKKAAAPPAESPSPWFRQTFTLAAKPTRATAYVNTLGYSELYVNGRKVGSDVLSPAVSEYSARSFYVAYDITPYLRPGKNCVGLWLGRGWYTFGRSGVKAGGPCIRAQFEVEAGGKLTRIATDESWKVAPSSYVTLGTGFSRQHIGERYDARADVPDWCTPGFDDHAWKTVALAPEFEGRAEAQSCPANRIGKRIPAAKITDLGNGLCEIDFGTALAGWMRLAMPKLESGQRITMHYAERRYPNVVGPDQTPAGPVRGTEVDRVFTGAREKVRYQICNQRDEFISAGRPGEQFCSKFNYHGFRYAIIEGLPAAPKPADAEALLIESDLEPSGTFECSNDLFNRIHQTNLWTIRCLDLGGYLVDCPHRERLGYGDGQVSIESCIMNMFMPAFYEKWLADWRDSQDPKNGEIPHTAPNWGGGGGTGWGGTLGAMAWRTYLYYGDRKVLEDNYEPLCRYLESIETHCKDGILRIYGGKWDFIGDWLPPHMAMDNPSWPPADCAEFFNNCYRVYLWDLRERMARILGKSDEAQRCAAKLAEMRPAIHKAFYKPEKGFYTLPEQSYLAFPLLTGVTPESEQATIMKKLEDDILVTRQGHLDSGMLGTYFMLQYLQSIHRNDLIATMVGQKTYPGWGYMVEQGATTFWEQWNGFWSTIHSCFTSVGGWFYQGVAGITPDPAAPGFKRFEVRPGVVGDLTWAKASFDSVQGRIAVAWDKKPNGRFALNVTVPPGSTACVFIPASRAEAVTEGGKPAAKQPGVRFLNMENGDKEKFAAFEVESGTYAFEALP